MSKEKYRQCSMERRLEDSVENTVSYIPEKYAQVGRVLKLKGESGVWSDGWVVNIVGAILEPPDIHKAIRQHRDRTGDSLPKKSV